MNIKIDKADTLFSRYIRIRDKECVRCRRLGDDNANGEPINGLQCSHYFGRRKESTRYDTENCDSLCMGCHQEWGSNDREAYRAFKVKQLGEKGFKLLTIRANTYKKKDRQMEIIKWTALLRNKELLKPYKPCV